MAIDFPSTSGQATDGSFTHTASGITWAWDGTTWKAQGSTSNYVLPTASSTVKGGIKVGTNLSISSDTLNLDSSLANMSSILVVAGGSDWVSIDQNGLQLSAAAGLGYTPLRFLGNTVSDYVQFKNSAMTGQHTYTLPTALPASNGHVLSATTAGVLSWVAQSGGGGAGTRTTANGTTSSIANNSAADLTIAAAKTYVLHEIEVDKAAWVTLYTDTTSRTNDASRTELEDPAAGAGVVAEVVTTGAVSQKITPGTIGFNLDGTPSANVYLKVVNKSGSTGTVQVTLKYLALEV